MDYIKTFLVLGVGFMVVTIGIAVVGCGAAMGLSLRAMVHQSSSYQAIQFRLANRCSGGLWRDAFEDKQYLILLQNSTELRATGGFMGSYARLKFEDSGISRVHVEDIYQPDGQLVGHVEPPYPIQEAFGQGWWRLRDSNWDADFASAAGTVKWFFEQGGEKPVDGIVATNVGLFKQWLGVMGPIKLETYDENVTESNLYSLSQKYAEIDSKTGLGNKRDFLGAVGARLLERTQQATVADQLRLGKLILSQLSLKQMLVWSDHPSVQKFVDARGWSGRLAPVVGDDYLYIVEDNLSGNKANILVDRSVRQSFLADSNQIEIEWRNDNPFAIPRPPVFWGGDYFVYTRVIVPATYAVSELQVGQKNLKRRDATTAVLLPSVLSGRSEGLYDVVVRDSLQMVGFWVRVPAGKSEVARLSLVGNKIGKAIVVRRQPGIDYFKYSLNIDGKIVYNQDVGEEMVIPMSGTTSFWSGKIWTWNK